MPGKYLMLPIQVDALCLDHPLQVAASMADFSRLPYYDGKSDVNSDTAYISENLVSQPFEKSRTLEAGVHLHWALPDSLTRSHPSNTDQGKPHPESTDITFPAVPTRWLVTRSIDGRPEKRWLLASDYLYPAAEANKGYASGSPTFPVGWNHDESDPALRENNAPPFRYLGRSWPLEDWLSQGKTNNIYWDGLTAIGYGEPTFAAFYPNCRNVFGFHDPAPIPEATYTVVGWYQRKEDDICSRGHSLATIKEEYQWEVEGKELSQDGSTKDSSATQIPSRSLCYAQIKIGSEAHLPNPDQNKPLQVSVGNTATEALSAFLAHNNDIEDAEKIRILEDQLEALHLAPGLEHRSVDVGPKFKEARHDKSFSPTPGGTIWTVRRVVEAAADKSDASTDKSQVTLSEELAHLLNQLNVLQQNVDSARFVVESWRERIFADWYKYMVKAYLPDDRRDENPPNADQIKYFIERYGLKPLEEAELRLENLEIDRKNKCEELKHQLVDTHALQQIAGPRYWQPNEPVVLLTGDAVKASNRHGQDGMLKCTMHNFSAEIFDRLNEIDLEKIDKAVQQALHYSRPSTGTPTCEHQPWTPFLLEWEVDFWPVGGPESNLHPANRRYKNDYVTKNYELPENAIELRLQGEAGQLSKQLVEHPSTYQGRSLLTPGAQVVLLHQVDEFLEKRLLHDYYTAKKIDKTERSQEYFGQHKDDVISWYRSLSAKNPDGEYKQDAFVDQLLKIRGKVTGESTSNSRMPALAQSLSGFNAAMLGHKQSMQLDIQDPLGFPEYQKFAKDVRSAIGKFNRVAPQPLNNFNPIRNGALRLDRLRLIDTFGQTRDLEKDLDHVITTDAMLSQGDSKLITLPPRLVQPARLNFRWLSSGHGQGHDDEDRREDVEMNTHPATSPICGWLVGNNLNNSLAVYESSGKALGYLNRNCHWQPARGSESALDGPTQIANPHLYRVVRWIIEKGVNDETLIEDGKNDKTFLSEFIDTLDTALENSDPENFAQHQDLALLMSRPLAVVRASLKLEQKGLPAINNEWYAYSDVLAMGKYETDNVGAVNFKARLGEHRQLNDGLAGYWVEDNDGSLSSATFFSPQGETDKSRNPASTLQDILTYEAGHVEQFQLDLNLQSEPQMLTMLVEPHGKVHATSGILPTKSINIPPDQFAPALAAMEVSFLSMPILTQQRETDGAPLVDLPLPEEAGYEWAWVEPGEIGKGETHQVGYVDRNANFSGQQVLREGWLLLRKQKEK